MTIEDKLGTISEEWISAWKSKKYDENLEAKTVAEKIVKESIDTYNSLGEGIDKNIDKLGQFYTPPEIVVKMLAGYTCSYEEFCNSSILDPTCGNGNLLAGALILGLAGENKNYAENVFGNELDEEPLRICRERLKKICIDFGANQIKKMGTDIWEWEEFWNWHLHQGDALRVECICDESFDVGYQWVWDNRDKFEGHVTWNGRRDIIKNKYKLTKKEESTEGKISKRKPITAEEYEEIKPENYKANPKDGGATYIYFESKTGPVRFGLNKKK